MALPSGPASPREAAAAYLRELLLRPGRSRRMWEQYAERNRPGQINQMAVAEVLARYLWDYPRRPGDTEILPRQLKDTASRALSGKLLSKAALGLFIEALDDHVGQIPYIYNTDALTIDLIQGCTGLGARLTEITSGFFATDMLLARPLGRGETLTLEYVTSFTYKPVAAEQMTGDLCEYRRAGRRRMENVDLRVEFDPGMLPRNVWWANWNGVAGEIINQESVALDSQNSAQRFLRFIEDTVVGFHWEW
jgi:hypothetical protein